ncbi:BlaI/MecI/CopY family transcriptional regulator [Fusibacillus kribbianus]|uniref:BlaI/MecI/CopY family transcriptional regulator n=1 Tax=Fusibacillus kribbianus TaxID=3044208 RepID=A0AAP4BAG4_9FIRM|nr:BlaI/MecI/CopY family transcriptional regulator [Ruminococcus sp. YH-rum2234]MDI9240966.1 BlaI/MecI/CopY family transcriptional regulator [Ruminococcus sp. YH-rum2234]
MRISNRMTERELTVMKAIWDIGDGATTAKIVKKLQEWYGEKLTPQAIGVYIDKLKKKNFIRITKPDNYYKVYEPLVSKEEFMKHQVQSIAKFWDQSTAQYGIMALSGEKKLTKEEADDLRRLLDDLD